LHFYELFEEIKSEMVGMIGMISGLRSYKLRRIR
jgi:hypothetical protein